MGFSRHITCIQCITIFQAPGNNISGIQKDADMRKRQHVSDAGNANRSVLSISISEMNLHMQRKRWRDKLSPYFKCSTKKIVKPARRAIIESGRRDDKNGME